MSEPGISVRSLEKTYGAVSAVAGLDLEVARGEIVALLGPNGAGKTTCVEVLEGYLAPDAGQVQVLGRDPWRAPAEWRARIGIVPQDGEVEAELSAREWLELWAGYYPRPRPVSEVLERVGLGSRADRRAGRLSSGERRRLDLALALVGDPELLFLDEPTTGFDPSARREAWQTIAELRGRGTTILLTTHSLEEASVLADRVAIVVAGRIVAEGPPDELAPSGARTVVSFRLPAGVSVSEVPCSRHDELEMSGGQVVLHAPEPVPALQRLTSWALERRVPLSGLEARRRTLEDVYLELTAGS